MANFGGNFQNAFSVNTVEIDDRVPAGHVMRLQYMADFLLRNFSVPAVIESNSSHLFVYSLFFNEAKNFPFITFTGEIEANLMAYGNYRALLNEQPRRSDSEILDAGLELMLMFTPTMNSIYLAMEAERLANANANFNFNANVNSNAEFERRINAFINGAVNANVNVDANVNANANDNARADVGANAVANAENNADIIDDDVADVIDDIIAIIDDNDDP